MTRAEAIGRRIGQAIHRHRRVAAVLFLLAFVLLIGGFVWHVVSRIQQGHVSGLIGTLVAMAVFMTVQWRKAAKERNN